MSRNLLLFSFLVLFIPAIISGQEYPPQNDSEEQQINYRRTEQHPTPSNQFLNNSFPLNKVTTGTGVWTELNPNILRTDYLCAHFVGDTGWAVGAEGAIILSTNNGAEWRLVSSPANNVLLNVDSYDGQVVIITGYDGIILRSSNGGETFNLIPSGVSGDLWRVKMLNDTLGWIAGMGPALLKTTDAGLNWQVINTGYNSFHYWSLAFPTKDIGYVACSNGNVLETTDGGINWQLKNIGDNRSLYSIVAFDTMHVIAGGALGRVAYTYDGGNTWGLTTAGTLINSIAFINDTLGFAVGNDEYSYYKTTDAGIGWDYISTSLFPIGPYWVMFNNESIGFNAGLDLTINKSIDSGFSWLPTILNDDFKDVYFTNETTGYIIGRRVYKTSDSGESWYALNNFPYNLTGHGGYSLSFTDLLTGFVGASWCWIFKTTNAGNDWYQVETTGLTDTTGEISKIYFINENVGWAVSTSGGIIKTIDGGDNWFAQLNLPADSFKDIFFIDTLNGWATSRYVWQTTDGGANWIERADIPAFFSNGVYFPNIDTGWVAAYSIINPSLYKTTNGGIDWVPIPEVVGARKFHFFPDPIHWIINGFGLRYITNDYGSTWIDIINDVPSGIASFQAPTNTIGYAVGSGGLILRYDDTIYVPVELVSFTGKTENNIVVLEWITASELNNYGFEIQRLIDNNKWEMAGFVPGKGTTTAKNYYTFSDPISYDGEINYRLKQIDYDGTFIYSEIITLIIEGSPPYFSLSQNFPNPFNNSTIITYQISKDVFVTLKVYDVLGNEVATLIEENKKAGHYKLTFSANDISTGIYFYKLTAGEYNGTKKLILLK